MAQEDDEDQEQRLINEGTLGVSYRASNWLTGVRRVQDMEEE